MALLPKTNLETHPLGTANPAGVVNSNWAVIENIFDEAISSGSQYGVLGKALQQGQAITTLTPAASVAINFVNRWQKLTPGQDTTFTFSGLRDGREVILWLVGDGTARTLTWPGAIFFNLLGVNTTLGINKNALVILRAFGATAGNVLVDYREV